MPQKQLGFFGFCRNFAPKGSNRPPTLQSKIQWAISQNTGVSSEGNFNEAELHFECSFQGYPTCLLFPFHLSPGHLKCRNCGQNAKFENCIFKDNPSAHLTKYTQLVLSCLKLLCECQLRRIS